MTVYLNKITIRNKLNIDIKDCTILYCASEQVRCEFGPSLDYLLNSKRVDVETGENVRWERYFGFFLNNNRIISEAYISIHIYLYSGGLCILAT